MPSGILWPHSVYGGKALPWRHNNFQPKMQSTEAPVGLHGDPAVEMKLQYNELMMAYIKERIDQPYDGDRTTARYVAASIAVLERTARALPASNADLAEALEDLGLSNGDLGERKAGFLPYLALIAGAAIVLWANWFFVLPG